MLTMVHDVPPPSGVPGCGASSIAKPGVKICPLETVKLSAMDRVTSPAMHAATNFGAIVRTDTLQAVSDELDKCDDFTTAWK